MRMENAGGELEQVKDDEGQNDGAAPVHGARGVGGVDGLFARVADRAGRLAAQRELHGDGDVQRDGEQHDAALDPEQLAEVVQEVSVGVDVLGGFEHLQIAEHVADDEGEHHAAGDCHDDFLAVRRLPEGDRSSLMRENPSGTH